MSSSSSSLAAAANPEQQAASAGHGSTIKTGSSQASLKKSKISGNKEEKEKSESSSNGGIFRPLVVLALPGVNLFRRFSQYKRLPQDPPKDKLEVELERLNSKIVSILDVCFKVKFSS